MKHTCGGNIFVYSDVAGLWLKCDKCYLADLVCPDPVFRKAAKVMAVSSVANEKSIR